MLTRHHVVPRRVKRKIPQPYRSYLSNVLFVCMDCHERYEQTPEPDIELGDDPLAFCRAWKEHFLCVMEPRCMPEGGDIISVGNIKKACGRETKRQESAKRQARQRLVLPRISPATSPAIPGQDPARSFPSGA